MELRNFLRTVIISNKFIYIDYWSIVHFITGMILANLGFSLQTAVLILLGFEFFEKYIQKSLFRRESFVDFVWDMIVGISGYLVFVTYIL